VREDKADAPDLVTCWKQAEPARALPALRKMPIMVMTSEASYQAPYDYRTVKYLQQAGLKLASSRPGSGLPSSASMATAT
jgi:hypothetical protein